MKYARFYLEKRGKDKADKKKEWPVVVCFHYNGRSFHRTIGLKCSEQNWDSKKQRVKPQHFEAEDSNRYIDDLESKINRIYSQALEEGRPIDNKHIIEQLKNPAKKTEPEKKNLTFFEEWERYLEVKAVCLQPGTLKSAKSTYNHFKRFCAESGLTNITFEDFTDKIKADFAELDIIIKVTQVLSSKVTHPS